MPGGESRAEEVAATLDRLVRDGRANAALAWAVLGVVVAVFVESALGADYRWVAVSGVTAAVAVAPAAGARSPRVMPPWEVLGLAASPVLVRALVGGTVGTFAAYLALAAVALLAVVELQTFTALRVTEWVAVLVVVATTLAATAVWTVVRWSADRLLGTAYLTTNEALMTEWVYVLAAGVAAGVLFESYFARRDRAVRRLLARLVGR